MFKKVFVCLAGYFTNQPKVNFELRFSVMNFKNNLLIQCGHPSCPFIALFKKLRHAVWLEKFLVAVVLLLSQFDL